MNKSLKTLFLYNSIFVFASYLLGSLYAIFAEGIVGNIFYVSITTAAFLFSRTIFTYLLSLNGDKVKEKEYFLLGGYLVRAIVWFLFAFAGNIQIIISLQILLGLGESLGTSAFDAIFADHLDRNKSIREYSNWHLIATLVAAISTLLGGLVVNKFGFSTLFFMMSGLAFISFLGVVTKPRDLL